MAAVYAVTVGSLLAGFLAGILTFYYVLKHHVRLVRKKKEHLLLRLPILGEIQTGCQVRRPGIYIDDWEELRAKLEKLARLMDPELVLRYAKEYRVNYVGFEGDRDDETWNPGRLAYIALSRDYEGGYGIFLNPKLNVKEISRSLSRELGEEIRPWEVQTFLFLHEIGHTTKTGNRSYFTELVNHSLSGGRRSVKRRRELRSLKGQIEKFSDQFALQELKKLRHNEARESA